MNRCEGEQRQDFPSYYSQANGSNGASASAPAVWNYNPTQTTAQRYISVSSIIVYVGAVADGQGYKQIPMVARVTLIDYHGNSLLDTYVRPVYHVTDYRTEFTGLNYTHLENAPTFAIVQHTVAQAIQNNIIIGHRIWDFLSIMGLSHPAIDTRDLALFRPLRKRLKSRCIVDLRTLCRLFIGKYIGRNYEDSMETALASLELFRACEQPFEGAINAGSWPCDLPPISFARHYM